MAIPLVDVAALRSPTATAARDAADAALHAALGEVGFAYLSGAAVPTALTEAVRHCSRAFFVRTHSPHHNNRPQVNCC